MGAVAVGVAMGLVVVVAHAATIKTIALAANSTGATRPLACGGTLARARRAGDGDMASYPVVWYRDGGLVPKYPQDSRQPDGCVAGRG
jgi:hypothetical protein